MILRELHEGDAKGLFELDSNPLVHRYLGNKPIKHLEECYKVIDFIKEQYIQNGIGRWAVIEKKSKRFAGWAGLKLVKDKINGHQNFHDLGYRLIQDFWGKGLATEASKAALNYGYNTMNLNEIFACANTDNAASKRVLEKLGFDYQEKFHYENALHEWYRHERKQQFE